MNPKILQSLFVHHGDADIKQMLAEHSITMQRPAPPNDVSMCQLRDKGVRWLVIHFYDPSDPGYVAYGLPDTTEESDWLAFTVFILESLNEAAASKGIDAFAQSAVIELPDLSVN